MKFTVKGTELNQILSKVIKGFNSKEDNSYVAFKLKEKSGELTVTARSRATFFEGKVKAQAIEIEDDEPRVYHLDGVKLNQLVSILPNAPVNIEFSITDETRSFTIKTATSKYKLPVLSETPLAPVPKVVEYVTVDALDFMSTAKNLIKIVSTDPSTQEHQVSCMHFSMQPKEVKMLATDAYALGSVTVESSSVDLENKKDVLIRHTEVATLLGSFSAGETLTLVGSDEMFGYTDENGTLSLVGVINMVPLDVAQVEGIARKDNTVLVDKGELKSAIETVNKLSPSDETVDLEISADGTQIRVSNRYGDYIDIVPTDAKLTSPGKATFATSVLLKSMNPAHSGPIRLEFGNLAKEEHGAVKIVSLQADGTDDEKTSLLATKMMG